MSSNNHNNNNKAESLIQIYFGPILSGAPFHSHGPAINQLIYGQKQWILLPPSKDVYSTIHPLQFTLNG